VNKILSGAVLASVFAVVQIERVSAHHSFAMFDSEQTLSVDAVVVELQWTNPHSWLEISIADGQGAHKEHTRLSLEMGSLISLKQDGWKPTTLKAGDKVLVTYHPMRDGTPAGQLVTVTFPNGSSVIEQ
jgi:hypothetical protein